MDTTRTAPDAAPIIADVARRLLASGRRLVTAESCTGGWIAKACTDVPGSSRWFRGGVVTYDDELKSTLLGVRPVTLRLHGAVSEATVLEMATGALARLRGEVAVAVSGIAGPDGGTPEKPCGTVWLAWASQLPAGVRTWSRCCRFDGDRADVRQQAVVAALEGVLDT